jgi:UDP-glucose 4-epimerase
LAVLVTGGAGYIGSHTVAALLERGEDVVIVDSLVTGHKASVLGGKLYIGDLRDEPFLARVFRENELDAVIHFAASSLVGESMTAPGKYYGNNVYGTLCLLEMMRKHEVGRIVFSSTAAAYGEPERIPIMENDRTQPTSVYGETKLAMERMIRWYETAYGIRSVALRYFNAAGAHPSGAIGEDHRPESHLIPLILQVPLGQRAHIAVFGDDYPTEDGTCIRDYIHVMDLADAHLLALKRLREGGGSAIYNLGNGTGFSVKQVIDIARQVTGHAIPAVIQPRRPGDPAVLVASSERARQELGWNPRYADLETIITDAWNWHRNHPEGYHDAE